MTVIIDLNNIQATLNVTPDSSKRQEEACLVPSYLEKGEQKMVAFLVAKEHCNQSVKYRDLTKVR